MQNTDPITETKAEFNARYGKWLREMREEAGLTQAAVAAAVGISVETLQKCESGEIIELYYSTLLCDFYGVDE